MRLLLPLAAMFVVAGVAAFAQMPPLIDRELFFGDPEISGAQISPDGGHISFLKPYHGVRNIWVKKFAEPFDQAHPLTADTTRPVTSYFWSRDGKYVLYAQDKGGDENYRIYAVDPQAAGNTVPPARDLTPMAKVRAMIIDVPKGTPSEILVGLNDRRADLHDVYRLNIVTGERTLIRKNEQNVAGWDTDLKGNLRLGIRQTPDGGTEILRVEPDTLVSIYSVTADEECGTVRFLPDGNSFYLETNKGAALDKTELQLFDLTKGTTTLVERDPKNEVDFGNAIFSDVTDELLATVYVGDKVRVYPKEKKFAADWEILNKQFPDGQFGITSRTADEKIYLVNVSSDVDPGSVYVFDRTTKKITLLYRSRPNLPTKDLAPMKAVRYTARDGMVIPAYLTLPKGLPAQNLPVVMMIHGGPWARDNWGYNSLAQFLANRGYAVLMPNFRGSTGFGKKFLNAGNKQWGTGSMQHDISDGVAYVIKEKIGDPKRIAIFGGSYGGYATLAGLAFTPSLYAAGVSYVGPSNIITLLKSIPPYWAPMKKMFAIRVGDIEKPEEVKILEQQSPLNSAKQITAPLLVIQGANDPRVKQAESDQIVVALRDLGRTVNYMVAPDEGHGFAGRDNRLAAFTAMEKFFSTHLGGRYQESLAPDIKKKLDALMVDVKTVKMPERPAESMAPPAVFDPTKIKAATLKYSATFAAMGQKFTMNTTRFVAAAAAAGKKIWRIVDISSGMMGAGTDTLDIDATSLAPLRRNAEQGGGGLQLVFAPEAITGMMSGGGMASPVDVKTKGLTLSDGAGVEIPLCALPLAQGYKASIQMFDLMGKKVRAMSVAVTGTEQVTTPAGTFDSYVLDVKPTDGESGAMKMWISVKEPRLVKSEAELPAAMGGGKVVTELLP
jgi:dipeptidyl aminopeptidase/acylaminoacyl peptidase